MSVLIHREGYQLTRNNPKRKRSGKWWMAMGLLGVFCLTSTTWGIWRIRIDSQINARLAAIKAAGYPVNGEELNAWYASVPDQENAAVVFMQVTNLMTNENRSADSENLKLNFKKLPKSSPLPQELKDFFNRELAANREALPLIHQVAKMSKCRYPEDLSPGMLMIFPRHYYLLRKSVELLQKEALLAAEGPSHGVSPYESVSTGFRLARTLKAEPVVISQLVRYAMDGIAINTLERLVNRAPASDKQLSEMAMALTDADDRACITRAYAGERAGTIRYFRMSKFRAELVLEIHNSKPSAFSTMAVRCVGTTGFFEPDLFFYLNAMETNIAILNMPFPECIDVASRAGEDFHDKAEESIYFLSSGFLPSIGSDVYKLAGHSAQTRAALAAVAIERYRLAHQNRLPGSLSDLVPAYLQSVPMDPWDGQPLRYKKLDKGYVVYSVGKDRKDDGGQEQALDKKGEKVDGPFDITFRVER